MGVPWGPISAISKDHAKTQEEKEKRPNFHMDRRGNPGETLVKWSLAFHNTKVLERAACELVTILGNICSYSSVCKGVAKAITSANSTEGGESNQGNLKCTWRLRMRNQLGLR